MSQPQQQESWETRFEEQFGFRLHEMVDGDWCPALGVPHFNPLRDTSSAKPQKPNYTVKQLQEQCECGGTQKIADIKAFISTERQRILDEVRGWSKKQPDVFIFDETRFIKEKDLLTALKELEEK